MKIYYIAVLKAETPAKVLAAAKDLSSFSFFERSAVGESLEFFSSTVAERTQKGQRQSVEEGRYIAHTHVRSEGIAGVLISDADYPVRVAYTLIGKVLDEFITQYPRAVQDQPSDGYSFPQLDEYIVKYQNPAQADTLMKVQQELDETKIVLHKTIESVLARGEKLDSLVDKSENLSMTTRQFYKQAKKTNSCCIIM
ncbi:hypothetical protein CANCADRAFT_32507 [Tortispora caseinolytica NRRL Y-17796]|uniref:Synaptobrevin homolog YKT6 n=1 Tax=Tortispora caseinolytica NRRL Y-17796 TaxID=767744 RepID=A0A1E4TBQ4_9ASCO|nr:hypothetical protein CANCADRAFT_32507 [Tortispora caseinolytica NRRL Y-17796]